MSDRSRLVIVTRAETYGQVVVLRGEVNLRSSPELHDALLGACETRPARIIIDLSGVEYMDSSGIGTLVDVKRRVDKFGGKLVLAALRPRVRGIFEITKLQQFFMLAATVDEAATL